MGYFYAALGFLVLSAFIILISAGILVTLNSLRLNVFEVTQPKSEILMTSTTCIEPWLIGLSNAFLPSRTAGRKTDFIIMDPTGVPITPIFALWAVLIFLRYVFIIVVAISALVLAVDPYANDTYFMRMIVVAIVAFLAACIGKKVCDGNIAHIQKAHATTMTLVASIEKFLDANVGKRKASECIEIVVALQSVVPVKCLEQVVKEVGLDKKKSTTADDGRRALEELLRQAETFEDGKLHPIQRLSREGQLAYQDLKSTLNS